MRPRASAPVSTKTTLRRRATGLRGPARRCRRRDRAPSGRRSSATRRLARMLNTDSRTRSDVGRMQSSSGDEQRLPRNLPATMRIQLRTRLARTRAACRRPGAHREACRHRDADHAGLLAIGARAAGTRRRGLPRPGRGPRPLSPNGRSPPGRGPRAGLSPKSRAGLSPKPRLGVAAPPPTCAEARAGLSPKLRAATITTRGGGRSPKSSRLGLPPKPPAPVP